MEIWELDVKVGSRKWSKEKNFLESLRKHIEETVELNAYKSTYSKYYELTIARQCKYRKVRLVNSSNTFRTIHIPSQELSILQKIILEELKEKFVLHSSATAVVGKSFLTNGREHVDAQDIFKTDIRSFYNNVTEEKILKTVEGYYPEHLQYLQDRMFILTLPEAIVRTQHTSFSPKFILPTGASTSPLLANIAMYSFDVVVQEYCDKNQAIYTRYLDDITLSFSEKLTTQKKKEVQTFVIEQLEILGYRISQQKTKWLNPQHDAMIITGIDIRKDPRVGNKYINEVVRPGINNQLKNILDSVHLFYMTQYSSVEQLILRVCDIRYSLNYVKQVNPEQYNKLMDWATKRFEVLAAYKYKSKQLAASGKDIYPEIVESMSYFNIVRWENLPF